MSERDDAPRDADRGGADLEEGYDPVLGDLDDSEGYDPEFDDAIGYDAEFDDLEDGTDLPTLTPEALADLGIGSGPADDHGEAHRDPPTVMGIPVVEPGRRSARVRRKLVLAWRRWQRSLNLRVVLTTMASLGVAFTLLLLVVTWQIRDGLYTERVDEILTDSAYRIALVQESYDASTATTTQEIQRLATGSVEQQVIGMTSGPVGATIMRPPGQAAATFSEPTTSITLRELVTPQIRQAVEGSEQYWQSVAIPQAGGGTLPGVVVGQSVTLPGVGRYQFYLVYSLATEEQATRVILQVLGIAGTVFILVVGLIVTLVVRSVLRPVKQAAQSAERLADGMLDERMEVRGKDEIARLGRSFNEMATSLQHQIERLAALSALQQRFVSDVSHELRTPLTTVKMAADLIYDGREDFPPQLRRSAELLQTQIDRFDAMLADLLEISRIDAGAAVLDLEDHDLRTIVGRVADLAQILAENNGSEIIVEVYEEPVVAECDGRRIERVIRNLVVNAVEHSEGGPVVITLAANATASAVRVRDHGVGMTREEAGRVFDRFWRADPARARTTGGTGLGLTISLEDARLHGGTLTATGRPGEGASFLLVLPHTAGATIEEAPLDLGELAHDPPDPPPVPVEPAAGKSIAEVETTRGEDDEADAQATAPDPAASTAVVVRSDGQDGWGERAWGTDPGESADEAEDAASEVPAAPEPPSKDENAGRKEEE